jgi:two-component system cell cycle response regulator DivK
MLARILIIEDDSFSRDLVKYLLEWSGYSVLVAENGNEGLSMALVAKPDLIICDLQMPVMNGYEVVHALKNQTDWRRVPVIAVTAFSMRGDRETALAAGFDEHISKPIAPEYFVAQIEAFLPTTLRAGRRVPY